MFFFFLICFQNIPRSPSHNLALISNTLTYELHHQLSLLILLLLRRMNCYSHSMSKRGDIRNTGVPSSKAATLHLGNPNAAGSSSSGLLTASHKHKHKSSGRRKRRRRRQRRSHLPRRPISGENPSSLTDQGRGQVGHDRINVSAWFQSYSPT